MSNLTFDRRPVSDPWVDLGGGVKGKNLTFSEHGNVAYQIKGNHRRSNMQHGSKYYARRAPPPPPPDPGGQKVKIQLFQNMVILHTKLKAITNAVTW